MNKETESEFRQIVKLAIASAMNEAAERDLELPWVGSYVTDIMTDAAVNVIRAIADAESFLVKNNMLKDE